MAKGSTGTSMGGSIEYTRMKKKKEPEAWEKPPRKKGLCPNCAFYYQEACTFDGTKDPCKEQCENFSSMRRTKKTEAERKEERAKRKEAERKKLEPLPCDCQKCINWRGKKGCKFHLQGKIKDGKCSRFATSATSGYTTVREERKQIAAHNRAVDTAKAAAKAETIPVVKLAVLQKVCESRMSMAYLRSCKTRCRPGNACYEIQCVNEEPLTIKMKGMKGARKTYIIEE